MHAPAFFFSLRCGVGMCAVLGPWLVLEAPLAGEALSWR